jgi:ketopantoate reductase
VDGKPVEVDAIWGEPLRRAQSKRMEVPEMDRIYRELKSKMRGQLNLTR